jgi:hypothetical protein
VYGEAAQGRRRRWAPWRPQSVDASGQQHEGRRVDLMRHSQYRRLVAMALLSFISMYVLMYAMVDSFANVLNNLNQVYMAGLMTAPMVLIELILMREMYENKWINNVIAATSIMAGVALFVLIRQQTAIKDKQFLRSMIPHHAGAILMCEEAPIQAPEIKELCRSIISSQQSEISQMKTILER